jgi:CDP-L-myo-inositol myo-inositolphosphotransferase
MKDGTVRAGAVVEFPTARDAQRRVAGVPAAARIAHELARAGFTRLWIVVASGETIEPSAWSEIHRLAGDMAVHGGAPLPDGDVTRFPADRLIAADAVPVYLAGKACPFIRLDTRGASAAILRGTGKPSDGIVSRTLNRPLSRHISAVLLRVPGITPMHATIGTAAIALAMFAALVFGGRTGLVVGALLFQAASVFDGVDGEIARATFRTSRAGAALDSAIDAATNVAAMLGLAINLELRGEHEALALGLSGLALLVIGLVMIGRSALREAGSVSFDGVKERYSGRFAGPVARRTMALATLGTSRDFCALVYLVLVLAGIPMAGLYLFAVVTPVWIAFVAAALWRDGAAGVANTAR